MGLYAVRLHLDGTDAHIHIVSVELRDEDAHSLIGTTQGLFNELMHRRNVKGDQLPHYVTVFDKPLVDGADDILDFRLRYGNSLKFFLITGMPKLVTGTKYKCSKMTIWNYELGRDIYTFKV